MVRRIAGEIHGFLVALLTALILGSVLALIVYWSPLKKPCSILADFTLMISVFIGGWYSAYRAGNRGLSRCYHRLTILHAHAPGDPGSQSRAGLFRFLY